jgi:hypothetical protein
MTMQQLAVRDEPSQLPAKLFGKWDLNGRVDANWGVWRARRRVHQA